jgi:hypothetical protein
MSEFKSNLSKGVFDPVVVNELSQAFGTARALVDRTIPRSAPKVEGVELARFILAEARSGETQPDLVAHAAAGKALLRRHRGQSKIAREYDEANSGVSVRTGSIHGTAKVTWLDAQSVDAAWRGSYAARLAPAREFFP